MFHSFKKLTLQLFNNITLSHSKKKIALCFCQDKNEAEKCYRFKKKQKKHQTWRRAVDIDQKSTIH